MYDIKIHELTAAETLEVKEKAEEKLGLCKKQNDIIGQQIFSILELYARVIYYPLGKDAVWGFTRIKGLKGESKGEKPFVTINSSIPLDCQVFAAAHELYHIWFDNKMDVIPANIIDETIYDRNELKANRFAAEFLVDEDLLFKELRTYQIDSKKIGMKDILKLSYLFLVPYYTMVKRLYEIKILSKADLIKYLAFTEEKISVERKRYSIISPLIDERISIDNLTELAVDAYEKKSITFEKLEYLLSISKLSPLDVGISEPLKNSFPSDDELDEIMEE